MPDRLLDPAVPRPRSTTLSVDVVTLTPRSRELAVLLRRAPDATGREKWELPWDGPRELESLEQCALRIARLAGRRDPTLLEQVACFGDSRRHVGGAAVSVGFLSLMPLGIDSGSAADSAWFKVSELPQLAPRQREILDSVVQAARSRVDQHPIAFRFLPETFTLSELQSIYEMLLNRRVHKASFRRALHASQLVDATDEWRSEGRGRPAQLFRYAPRTQKAARRGVRFDLVGA